jgi:hypothetical protein
MIWREQRPAGLPRSAWLGKPVAFSFVYGRGMHAMRLRPKGLVLFVISFWLYLASYLAWSRCFGWSGGRLWSFFPPPGGLVNLNLRAQYSLFVKGPWEGWMCVEPIPGTAYLPCIVVEAHLSGRIYLPTYRGTVCLN